jgi:hypothetical protein
MRQLVGNGTIHPGPSTSQAKLLWAAIGLASTQRASLTWYVCSRRPLRPAMPPPFPLPEAVVKNTDGTSARAFEGAWAALDKSMLLLVALVCANKLSPKPYTKPVHTSTIHMPIRTRTFTQALTLAPQPRARSVHGLPPVQGWSLPDFGRYKAAAV